MHYATTDCDLSNPINYKKWPYTQLDASNKANPSTSGICYISGPMGVCYISGPMSGLPELNYPAFFAAEEQLRSNFSKILNPARLKLDEGQSITWENWMRKAIAMMTEATHIFLLPGWQNSRGARLEVVIAESLGIIIFS